MLAYCARNWDYYLSVGNAGFALATLASMPWDKLATCLFVTLPVGLWSWYRLIDYLKTRHAKHIRRHH